MYSGPHRRNRAPRGTSALLIFIKKDVFTLRSIERLIELGIDPEVAVDTAIAYMKQADEEGLEEYVRDMERKILGVTHSDR